MSNNIVQIFSSTLEDDSAEDDLTLDFGKTYIGETPKTLLILKNETAIKTTYSIEVEHFHPGRTPTPPLGIGYVLKPRRAIHEKYLTLLVLFRSFDMAPCTYVVLFCS